MRDPARREGADLGRGETDGTAARVPGRQAPFSPDGFEFFVHRLVDRLGVGLEDFRATRREVINAEDGTFEIDVTARFGALGAHFLVLIECKHHRRPVERKAVQELHSKINSLNAQKGMMFSSSGYQRGAVHYAEAHGIALVQITCNEATYFTRADGAARLAEWGPYRVWVVRSMRGGHPSMEPMEGAAQLGVPA